MPNMLVNVRITAYVLFQANLFSCVVKICKGSLFSNDRLFFKSAYKVNISIKVCSWHAIARTKQLKSFTTHKILFMYLPLWRFSSSWVVFDYGERYLATGCQRISAGAAHLHRQPIKTLTSFYIGVNYIP